VDFFSHENIYFCHLPTKCRTKLLEKSASKILQSYEEPLVQRGWSVMKLGIITCQHSYFIWYMYTHLWPGLSNMEYWVFSMQSSRTNKIFSSMQIMYASLKKKTLFQGKLSGNFLQTTSNTWACWKAISTQDPPNI
jgi:hypothetical protein